MSTGDQPLTTDDGPVPEWYCNDLRQYRTIHPLPPLRDNLPHGTLRGYTKMYSDFGTDRVYLLLVGC